MYRKIIEKSMFFYISVAGGGGAKLILRIAYVVRSLYFNFQPIRTIFTMFSPRTAKTTHLSSPPLIRDASKNNIFCFSKTFLYNNFKNTNFGFDATFKIYGILGSQFSFLQTLFF